MFYTFHEGGVKEQWEDRGKMQQLGGAGVVAQAGEEPAGALLKSSAIFRTDFFERRFQEELGKQYFPFVKEINIFF